MGKANRVKEFTERQRRLHEIIFEADTPAGKAFDVFLLVIILLSILVVNLESVPTINAQYGRELYIIEWVVTIFFTIEYGLRIYCSFKPLKYITSTYGIIDLLSILPTVLSLFIVGSSSLIIIRGLRLLRIFRIFKMVGFLNQGTIIVDALKGSRNKIAVFLFFIFVMVNIIGSLMYLIEGGTNEAFDSIPRAVYWSIVTLTTVGYGDITPQTVLGQSIASIVMILGYAVIAVPTGIVVQELNSLSGKKQHELSTQVCMHCHRVGHDIDAEFCKFCGGHLDAR